MPHRSDKEIEQYVASEVEAGRIPHHLAHRYEQALRDEAHGKCVVMRDPQIRPKPPRKPSWEL